MNMKKVSLDALVQLLSMHGVLGGLVQKIYLKADNLIDFSLSVIETKSI